ncbi:ABC transporter permease/substrate-binding protein [Streptococcus cuniculi]|uniref:ABC transporter permease/substrate-binding protein n=1 Tax=Streptococcus cuniculi TaxID=1432788 RepID=A0A4Y9JAV3_9STRE|nr:ABC transporter permease/substrate-binding protein [Streptococcus cuniculi]MBF0778378.1 ABC transporter permease/substrate-binding protein [Streptococcus cuniculi]TFU97661.1 ABC transporter permease/substrate-binding protein [Streptococcus cuniculi]
MNDLIQTFLDRKQDWLLALGEHLQISFVALACAILIAIPLAILVSKRERLANLSLQFTGMLQTIPSLAILGLLIPIFGIGKVPAILTLIVYAIFPILQNTITGLQEIDPSLQEAATAFGMNRWEKLTKFEIALAAPVILSGIRTATVLIIGTATLAALIGAGGLGSFILLGIDRNNSSLILIGAFSSASLALLFHFLIGLVEKRSLKIMFVSFVALFCISSLSLFPMSMMMQDKIVIAGKLGSEPEILLNMYKELIEDKTDIAVELKPNFGKTTFVYEALKAGQIDLYPEFTGTVTSTLLKQPPSTSTNPEEVYQAARKGIFAQDKLVYLKPMRYQNTYALAVKEDYAKEHGLNTISDLATVQSTATAGFSLEFNDREDGGNGLKDRYKLQLNVKTLEPALRYKAIDNGNVHIIDAYSTDSELQEYHLKTLQDDKQLFPPYQGAPLLREETLKKYPQLEDILNQLAGKITEKEMQTMNYQVNVEGKSPSQVSKTYLKEHKLIGD